MRSKIRIRLRLQDNTHHIYSWHFLPSSLHFSLSLSMLSFMCIVFRRLFAQILCRAHTSTSTYAHTNMCRGTCTRTQTHTFSQNLGNPHTRLMYACMCVIMQVLTKAAAVSNLELVLSAVWKQVYLARDHIHLCKFITLTRVCAFFACRMNVVSSLCAYALISCAHQHNNHLKARKQVEATQKEQIKRCMYAYS